MILTAENLCYLDSLECLEAHVGHGDRGLHGALGYEGKAVTVHRRSYSHALSAHAPSRLVYALNGRFRRFRCEVALNDDVSAGVSHAAFTVFADGRPVAQAPFVVSGASPHPMEADVTGTQVLELEIETASWPYCHTVWLDPIVDDAPATSVPATLLDPLRRAEIALPPRQPRVDRCIATLVSPGFERLLADMLGSLYANGNCRNVPLVVFALNPDSACEEIVARHGGLLVRCRPHAAINPMSKSILYSVARVVEARRYLCLDADMLILDDLNPLFGTIEGCPDGSILSCREANHEYPYRLIDAIRSTYRGSPQDIRQILGRMSGEPDYSLVVNDGLFAGGRAALLALDGVIRTMPGAISWIDERRDVWWRNQFIFNLALARMNCGIELNGLYNVQLHDQNVVFQRREAGNGESKIDALWRGQMARIVHFCGIGRNKNPEWRGLFAHLPERTAPT